MSDFSLGDLVWAKLDGHPFWPSLVCKCKKENAYTREKKQGPQLHVQFFSTPTTHAWVKLKNVRPYLGTDVTECKPGGMFFSSKKTLWSAVSKAEKAEFMTIKERLKLVRTYGSSAEEEVMDSDDEEDESITSPKKFSGSKKRKHSGESSKSNKKVKKTKDSFDESPKSNKKVKKTKDSFDVSQTYIIGKSKIPEKWETVFVLMDINDVPEDLTPDSFIKVHDQKTKIKLEIPDENGVNDLDSEDEILDSDEDPGWTPEQEEDDLDLPAEDPGELEEESFEDSDEDPRWSPTKVKKKTGNQTPKFGLIHKQKSPKSRSLTKKSSKSSASTSSTKSPKSTVSKQLPLDSSMAQTNSAKNLVITDNTPTGPEPEIGDFVLEKAECRDGHIPFLWRYKRGGLIQKYERIEEDGKVLYHNVLNFSDWWSCFAHKYLKVETQVMYKHRSVEKVALIGNPVTQLDQEHQSAPSTATTPKTTSPPTTSNNKKEPSKKRSVERTQEQEISSTTQDTSHDSSDPDFQIGQFVLDLKDRRNVDNFPIWKIESQILLKKYEAVIRNGKLLHRAVKTYRGYRDISKHYLPVKVNRCTDIRGEEHLEVTEDTKPKITVSSSMEEEYEKNPLLRHFYVYMQVFLSQALEPGFLDEVRKTNDPTYMFPLGEIDKIVEQKAINIERKVKWVDKIKDALKKCPYLREVNKPDDKRNCEALVDSEDNVEESVFLFGSDYDKTTLKQSGNSHACQEFKIGKTAVKHISTYHQLCHFRYNLYDKCLAKIKLIRDSKEGGIEVEKIMDECLGNKSWVLQNFEDFMTLVEMT